MLINDNLKLATLPISDLSLGGNIGTASTTVDIASSFNINQATAGQAITLPNPTETTAGQLVVVSNTGSASFTMYGNLIAPNQRVLLNWDGASWNLALTNTSLTTPSKTNYYGFYDFINNASNGEWAITRSGTGAGSSIASIATADNDSIGIIELTTGTVITGRASVNTNVTLLSNTATAINFECRFRILTLNNGVDDSHYRIGLCSNSTGESNNGMYLRYSSGNANFIAVSRKNTTETAVNTGIPVVANTFYKLKIIATTSVVQYLINDTLVASINTNIPSGTAEAFGWLVGIFKQTGLLARSLQVDYVEIQKSVNR